MGTTDSFLIEWDVPIPDPPPKMFAAKNRWSDRLDDFRKQPGRRARIWHKIPSGTAHWRIRDVVKALEANNPREVWKFERRMDESEGQKAKSHGDGTMSVWCTFLGVRTEPEQAMYERERRARVAKREKATRERKDRERRLAVAERVAGVPPRRSGQR